ncbi:hypothetical protein [Romboutsia sp.]|uniref:hypothetical protein n=1 Tax=Romboutsia sp. TaxID=1965302 RepID=UPI003F3B6E56
MYVDLEIMELFEELESIVKNASSIPFTHKSGIDKNEVLGIINEIKAIIPEEVKQASWINKERNKIINDSKKEAEEIREQAKREAEIIKSENKNQMEEIKKNSEEILQAYVEASEPVAKADEKAKGIVSRAENVAREIKLGSIEYAEDVLSSVEYTLKNLLQEVERDRKELNSGK